MLRCNEVTRLCASGDLAEASAIRRFRVRLHLVMCTHCRRYVDQIRAIGGAAAEMQQASELNEDRVAAMIALVVPGRSSADTPDGSPSGDL